MNLFYALRILRRNPGFTAASVITLALASGANIAIFSIVNSILLRPLPFSDPDHLVRVRDIPPGGGQFAIAPANFLDWRASSKTLEMAAFKGAALNLTGSGEPMRVHAMRVTANIFSLLGVAPWRGRTFLPEQDDPSQSRVAIISHALWMNRFAGESALGRGLILNGQTYSLMGVMPPGFHFFQDSDVWIPMAWTAADREARGAHYIQAIGRLRPGATLEQGRSEIDGIARRLAAEFPDDKDWGVRITPLIDDTVGPLRTALWVLAGAVGLVLLIGCVNVANLLLVRSAARRKEMSIRAALGAGRLRLVQQLFTEGIVLAFLGTGAGLALAPWAVRLIVALAPANVPRLNEASLDSLSLLFSITIVLLTTVTFAFTPAAHLTRVELSDSLKEGERTGLTARRGRSRRLLVISETALAALLLIGAGLLMKSFLRLQDVKLGFDPSNVLTMSVALPGARYQTPEHWSAFFEDLLERVRALPGVRTAAVVGSPPFLLDSIYTVYKEGHTARGEGFGLNFYNVSPAYFETMRIPLLKGRVFTEHDAHTAPRVAIINESAANRMFAKEDPIGKRVDITNEKGQVWRQIVGVVGDTKQYGRDAANTRQIYEPYLQKPSDTMTLAIRTFGDPPKLANAARAQVQAIDKDQPVADIQTMEEIVSRSVGDRRFTMLLFMVFAGLAVLLAAVGTYGVMAYTVAQRTHEIGVRIAIGARGRHILGLVASEGVSLAGIGMVIGAGAAVALTRVLKSQLYEVTATDPLVFSAVALLLLAVALFATLIPAVRAISVDPIRALRHE